MIRKLDKHYKIREDLIKKIQKNSSGKFNTEIQAVEYYIEKGIEFEQVELFRDNLTSSLNYCIKEILYIKLLLEQLFANKNFASNREMKRDDSLRDFRENIYNEKFFR